MKENEIISVLSSKDNLSKISILQKLVKSSSSEIKPEIVSQLIVLVEDKDIAVRFWAKKVYSKHKPLIETSSDKESIEEELSIDVLFQKLRAAQSHFVANEVLTKIFNKKDPASSKPLAEYLKNCSDPIVISFLVKNFSIFFPDEATLAIVAPYLKHKDDRVVANCVEGLEFISSPKATVLINQMLTHENHRVKANAAKALASKDPETTKKVIRFMLQAKDKPHFVIAACHATGSLKYEDFLPELANLVPDSLLAESALNAIVNIGGENAISYLEAFASETKDEEFKKKIEKDIASLKLKLNMHKVGAAVTSVLKDGKQAGKDIFEKMKEAAASKFNKPNEATVSSSNVKESSHLPGKNTKFADFNSRNSLRKFFSLKKVALISVVILLPVLYVFLSPSPKVTSKQAGENILKISNKSLSLIENTSTVSKTSDMISNVSGKIAYLDWALKPVEKLHNYSVDGESIYDALKKKAENPEVVDQFKVTMEGFITILRELIDKASDLKVLSKDFGRPFRDFEKGISALKRGAFSWQNFDQIVTSSEEILAYNEKFKEKIDYFHTKMGSAKQYVTELSANPTLNSLLEWRLIGTLASIAIKTFSKLVEMIDWAQEKMVSLKSIFGNYETFFGQIVSYSRNIEKIPD